MHLRSLVLAALAGALCLSCAHDQIGRVQAVGTGATDLGSAPRGRFDRVATAACGPGGVTRAGAAVLGRRPHLLGAGATLDLAWTTRRSETATVHVTTPDGRPVATAIGQRRANPVAGAVAYRSALADLAPETTYCYELRAGDEILVARTGFTTPPAPGAAAPIRFAAVGDVGRRGVDQRAVLEQLQRVELDFLIVTGDPLFDGGPPELLDRDFFSAYGELLANVPLVVAGAQPRGASTSGWRSLDWGSVHIVVLDTDRVGPEQAAWLEADLRANRQPWTIAIARRPPLSSLQDEPDAAIQKYLVPLLERYGVQLVISGDDHHYERSRTINGVDYVVSGAGGRGTRRARPSGFTAFVEPVSHFLYVDVDPGRLRLWAIDGTGRSFDSHARAANRSADDQNRAGGMAHR